MIRKKKDFKVDLIISADWHLMEKERNPPCRTDNHWDAQWDKVKQVLDLQYKYGCPIELAGDLLEYWKASPELLNKCFETFAFKEIYSIIGNHDAPQHNLDLMDKSGWTSLLLANCLNYSRNQLDWDVNPKDVISKTFRKHKGAKREIVLAHKMIWKDKEPWPGCTDPQANKMFKLFPKADLIITGHNHKTFTATKGNQLLINPGSLTRHKADQINHKPAVFLWKAESNTFKIHYLNIKEDVISREHIEIQKHKEERASAFIEKLKDNWDIGLSFEENIERAFQENDINKNIKEIVLEWMEV